MKKLIPFVAFLLFGYTAISQVGIGNTDPKASLDISATNSATPANTDGLLIPRIDEFPSTTPTADQDGMMVFITGNGAPAKGFYYWNNAGTSWDAFAGSSDADWFLEGSTNVPTAITDNIYTQGNVAIGSTSAINGQLEIRTSLTNRNNAIYSSFTGTAPSGTAVGITNRISIDDNSFLYGTVNRIEGNTSGLVMGFRNEFLNTGSSWRLGLANYFSDTGSPSRLEGLYNDITTTGASLIRGVNNQTFGFSTLTGEVIGVRNDFLHNGSANIYGSYTNMSGTNSGTKYGTYNRILSSMGGTHYGIYSDVQNTSGYAGYFIGRSSFGNTGSNRYILPAADGTNGQVMTTDGSGNVSFQDAPGGMPLDEAYDFGGLGAGRTIVADNGAVDIQGAGGLRVEGNISAASNIVHDGDIDTYIQFLPDRVQFDAGGINYINIQNANQEIAFNEDSSEIDFRIEGGTNQNMFFVDASRNRIGIGTDTPNASLNIGTLNNFNTNVGAAGQDGIFIRGSETSGLNEVGGSIAFGGAHPARDNSRRAAIASMQTGIDEDNVGLAFYIHPGPVNTNPMEEAMRITHQKYLGINNISPSATLDVVGTMQYEDGNEAAGYVLSSDAFGNASWVDPASTFSVSANNGTNFDGTNVQLGGALTENTTINQGNFDMHYQLGSGSTADFQVIRGGGSNLITAENDGYILLGDTATLPNPRLQVTGGANFGSYMADFYNNSANPDAAAVSIRVRTSVAHSGNYIGFFKDGTTLTGHINGNGSGGVNYSTVSDRRLKTSILDINNSLEIINKIQPRIYEYKTNTGKKEYGFIAQELQEVYPQAVFGDPNGDVNAEPMMVDYGRLTPILTAAIQELNDKIEMLKAKNQKMEAKLKAFETLEDRLSALEKEMDAPTVQVLTAEK